MAVPQRDIDLTNLLRFLKHLGHPERDAVSAGLAKKLLDEGCEVVRFSGPEQMDVWELIVRRGSHLVRFGIERGFSDRALVRPADETAHAPRYVPVTFAVLGWARATGVDLVFEGPDDFRPDLRAYGIPALDWLDEANDHVLMRINAAWLESRYRLHGRNDPDRLSDLKALSIRQIEEAAAPKRPLL